MFTAMLGGMPTFARVFRTVLPVHTRRGLLAVTVGLQAVILSVGLLVVFNDIRHRVALRLEDRILEQNIRTAESLARTMDEMEFGIAQCGTVGRERAQKMIEELRLPAGGFVCLLDENDKIICHPKLREEPLLCGIDLRDLPVEGGDGSKTALAEADRDRTIAGRTVFLDRGTHYLAAKYIPSMKARLLVQQPESGLLAFGEAVASASMLRSAGLGALALVLTGVAAFVLIRRHNVALEGINAGLEREVERRVGESLAARHSIIVGLARLAESRDRDTGDHLERIATYSAILAERLRDRFPEIDDAWVRELMLASSLHDIGKVGVPDSVLLKPGKLTPEERAVIERHPLIGADTLAAVRVSMGEHGRDDALLSMSIDIARSHHERWDGRGYPDGLVGDAIPLAARIVALADVYDALTSPRVYKPAMPHDEAAGIIREGRGKHFDPAVVEAFDAALDAFALAHARFWPVEDRLGEAGLGEGGLGEGSGPAGVVGTAAAEPVRAAA